jgi:hypothetical protein
MRPQRDDVRVRMSELVATRGDFMRTDVRKGSPPSVVCLVEPSPPTSERLAVGLDVARVSDRNRDEDDHGPGVELDGSRFEPLADLHADFFRALLLTALADEMLSTRVPANVASTRATALHTESLARAAVEPLHVRVF